MPANSRFELNSEAVMQGKSTVIFCLAGALLALPAFAAKFWETKEFTQWTENECMELLRKSPWASTNVFGNQPPIGIQLGSNPPGGFGESQSSHIFEVRALSALPIRLAFAQLELLKRPNDPAFREQMLKMANMDPGKEIAIQLSYRVIPSGSSAVMDIHSFFLHATLADFLNTTYLIADKTGNIHPSRYLAPNEQRPNPMFLFPRFKEQGEPLFTGAEKSITFRSEFSPELQGNKRKYNIFVKLNPKDMRFKEAFAF
jgi:hypothetical protein